MVVGKDKKKQFDILKEYLKDHTIPSNFKIYLSFWNEFQADAELSSKFQIAYYNDFEHETLIDWDSSFTCPGECPKCKFKCWKTKDNVIFNRH